jgi:hypothetical protein
MKDPSSFFLGKVSQEARSRTLGWIGLLDLTTDVHLDLVRE